MFKSPSSRTDTDLDPGLLLASSVVITRSDPLGDLVPKLPALPLALLLDGLYGNLLLGGVGINKDGRRLCDRSDPGPLAFESVDFLAVVRELSLERVRLARNPAFALVIYLCRHQLKRDYDHSAKRTTAV